MDDKVTAQTREDMQKTQQNMLGVLIGAATGALIGFVLADQKRRQFLWEKFQQVDNNSLHLVDYIKEKTDEYKKGGIKKLTEKSSELLD